MGKDFDAIEALQSVLENSVFEEDLNHELSTRFRVMGPR